MTIRTSAPITFTPGSDFFRTDRGITWGIKVTVTAAVAFATVFVRGADGTWSAEANLDEMLDTRSGPVGDWMRDVLLPKLNAWLRLKFPPLGPDAPPPSPATFYEQADAAIQGLRIIAHADGTLTAEA